MLLIYATDTIKMFDKFLAVHMFSLENKEDKVNKETQTGK